MNNKWKRSLLDTIKYNIDVSYDIHTCLAWIDMVLGDHLGQFIAEKKL